MDTKETPKPSEFKIYRLSDDAMTPNLRLILDIVPGMVTLYEADMTSRRAEAQETEVHDKILMSPADARWLRDALNSADPVRPAWVERSGRRKVKPNGRRRWRKWAKRWRRGQTLARADAIPRRAKSVPLPGLR